MINVDKFDLNSKLWGESSDNALCIEELDKIHPSKLFFATFLSVLGQGGASTSEDEGGGRLCFHGVNNRHCPVGLLLKDSKLSVTVIEGSSLESIMRLAEDSNLITSAFFERMFPLEETGRFNLEKSRKMILDTQRIHDSCAVNTRGDFHFLNEFHYKMLSYSMRENIGGVEERAIMPALLSEALLSSIN